MEVIASWQEICKNQVTIILIFMRAEVLLFGWRSNLIDLDNARILVCMKEYCDGYHYPHLFIDHYKFKFRIYKCRVVKSVWGFHVWLLRWGRTRREQVYVESLQLHDGFAILVTGFRGHYFLEANIPKSQNTQQICGLDSWRHEQLHIETNIRSLNFYGDRSEEIRNRWRNDREVHQNRSRYLW